MELRERVRRLAEKLRKIEVEYMDRWEKLRKADISEEEYLRKSENMQLEEIEEIDKAVKNYIGVEANWVFDMDMGRYMLIVDLDEHGNITIVQIDIEEGKGHYRTLNGWRLF